MGEDLAGGTVFCLYYQGLLAHHQAGKDSCNVMLQLFEIILALQNKCKIVKHTG